LTFISTSLPSIEGLECNKDIQKKANNVTKLTAELKSDNVHYTQFIKDNCSPKAGLKIKNKIDK